MTANNETGDYRVWRLREISEGRRFYTMKTLLGGKPDRNRRLIYDHTTGSHVETFNYDMNPWTDEDEERLTRRLAELNAGAA